MEKENLELERQRIEIERQKLELERQKLEFEKNIDSQKSRNTDLYGKSPNIAAVILALISLISLFLPWVSSIGGSLNMLNEGFVSFIGPFGYFCILISLGMTVMSFLRFKYSFLLGILNLIIALIPVLKILDAVHGLSQFFEGGIGIILFFMSGILYILVSLIDLRTISSGNSEKSDLMNELKKIIQLYQSEFILSIACFFVLLTAFDKYIFIVNFSQFFWTLLWFGFIPSFVFYRLKMNKTLILFIAYPLFITLNYLYIFIGSLFDGFTYSSFGNNFGESLSINFSWFGFVFYILIFLSIVIEYIKIKDKSVNEKLLKFYNSISKPIIFYLIIFAPLLISMVYYSFSRTNLTENDYKNFNQRNSTFAGDWFLLNSDSTQILVLKINPTISNQEEQYSSNVSASLEYSLETIDKENIGYGKLDTVVEYTQTLKLPFKIGDIKINDLNGEMLGVSIKMSNGSLINTNARRTSDQFSKIVKDKNGDKVLNNMIGVYSGNFGENDIMLRIMKINQKNFNVIGSNSVSGNIRPLKGTVEIMENICYFVLNEPGDEDFDGVFEFKISKNYPNEIQGVWRANNGELEREYVLYKQ
jgi:hypothetical protein